MQKWSLNNKQLLFRYWRFNSKQNEKYYPLGKFLTTSFTKWVYQQDQESKAPSRDYLNSSFMTRLDSIRVED